MPTKTRPGPRQPTLSESGQLGLGLPAERRMTAGRTCPGQIGVRLWLVAARPDPSRPKANQDTSRPAASGEWRRSSPDNWATACRRTGGVMMPNLSESGQCPQLARVGVGSSNSAQAEHETHTSGYIRAGST